MNILFYFKDINSLDENKISKWKDLFAKINSTKYNVKILSEKNIDLKNFSTFDFDNKIFIENKLTYIFSFYSVIKNLRNKINFYNIHNIKNFFKIIYRYYFWKKLLNKHHINSVYLMDPRDLVYDYDTIILEHICISLNISFFFIRETLSFFNPAIHNNLRRVDNNLLNKLNKLHKYEITGEEKDIINNYTKSFKKHISSNFFTKYSKFKYSKKKLNKIYKKLQINKNILLLLTKENNKREFYINGKFYFSLKFVRYLKKNIPNDYSIIIKEHPLSKIKYKDKSKLRKISKVHIFENEFNTFDLVEKTNLVISTTSHAAFQSLIFYKKNILIFGFDTFIFGINNDLFLTIKNLRYLKSKISKALNFKVDEEKIDKIILLIHKNTLSWGTSQEKYLNNLELKKFPYDLDVIKKKILENINR